MNIKNRVTSIFNHSSSDQPIDAVIIKNGSESFIDQNFFYATGIKEGLFEGCCIVLFPDGTIDIIVTELESDIAKQSNARIHLYQSKSDMISLLKDLLRGTKIIGINATGLLYNDYQWLSMNLDGKVFKDITNAINKTRMIKDNDELNAIKKACEIADRVMEQIGSYLKKNMTENELAGEIDYHLQRYGAHHPAFETIASFGSNTAIPHYTHKNMRLNIGDFVLCDFGACYEKYHSDMTRTFVFGKASEKQKNIHRIVLEAQKKGIETIKPGLLANHVHDTVKSLIDSTEYKECFIHSTGHSLGLSVHDPGIGFSSLYECPLQEHMVLTVEPGVYISGFGGVRIEDDIVVTKKECELLTRSSRILQEF